MGIVERVIDSYGGIKAVQKRFKYTSPVAVYQWKTRGIPKDKIVDIHLETGLPLKQLNNKPTG